MERDSGMLPRKLKGRELEEQGNVSDWEKDCTEKREKERTIERKCEEKGLDF